MAILCESMGQIWRGGRGLYSSENYGGAEKAGKELVEGVVKIAGVMGATVVMPWLPKVRKGMSLSEILYIPAALLFESSSPETSLEGISIWVLFKGIYVLRKGNTRGAILIGMGVASLAFIYFCKSDQVFKNYWAERKIQQFSSWCVPKLAAMRHKLPEGEGR